MPRNNNAETLNHSQDADRHNKMEHKNSGK
jgi:hypothetical protein